MTGDLSRRVRSWLVGGSVALLGSPDLRRGLVQTGAPDHERQLSASDSSMTRFQVPSIIGMNSGAPAGFIQTCQR